MIKELVLKNIQSHNDTHLVLHPGVNTIVGSSDKGKSSIFRGLKWNMNNKPDGTAIASYWAKNEKEKLVDIVESTIIYDDGVVSRIRGPKENVYLLNGKEQKAMKRGEVPTNVAEFQKISDINIQNQHDAAFMLSKTSGKVAEALNKYVNMDIIDISLANINSKFKKQKQIKLYKDTEIQKLKDQIAELDFIDKVESRLNRVKLLDVKRKDRNQANINISDIIDDVEEITEDELSLKDMIQYADVITMLKSLQSELTTKKSDVIIVDELIDSLNDIEDNIQEFETIIEHSKSVSRLNILTRKLNAAYISSKSINNTIEDLDYIKDKEISLAKISTIDTSVIQRRIDKLNRIQDKTSSMDLVITDLIHSDKYFIDVQTDLTILKDDYNKIKPDTCPVCHSIFK